MKRKMKNKNYFLLCGVLVFAIILTNIPLTTYATIYNKGYDLVSQYVTMTEDEIYEEKVNESSEALLTEIREIEKELNAGDEIILLPYATALLEKKDDFSQEEILHLLKDKETEAVLESVFIRMYIDNKFDKEEFTSLLGSSELNRESKEYIVALSDLNNEELINIYHTNDNAVAVTAMKKLMLNDSEMALKIASKTLLQEAEKISNEKLIAACLGIGEYYSKNKDVDKSKALIVEKMKALFSSSKDDMVKDNIIYAMARMNDFEVFKYIIEADEIDTALKVSTIERNLNLMIENVSAKTSQEDLHVIEKAMKIHPILEVGEALKASMANEGIRLQSSTVSETIDYIKENGIKGVFKYE